MSLFKNYFYHDLTRKYNLIFGSLFQDIEVKRFEADGTVKSMITVPLIHSPKEKFIQRIIGDRDPDGDDSAEQRGDRRRIALSLPMIAYEMVDMQYDGSRKVAKNQHFRLRPPAVSDMSDALYTPAPYTLTFEVNIAAKSQSEMLQIIEQIVPAFTPDVNITLKGIPNMDYDVPITFIGLFRNDTYLGHFEDRRQLMWTLNFTMKAFYFTPLNRKNIILNVNAPIFDMIDDDLSNAELIETFNANESDLIGEWTDNE